MCIHIFIYLDNKLEIKRFYSNVIWVITHGKSLESSMQLFYPTDRQFFKKILPRAYCMHLSRPGAFCNKEKVKNAIRYWLGKQKPDFYKENTLNSCQVGHNGWVYRGNYVEKS